jgi:hypothetical protein
MASKEEKGKARMRATEKQPPSPSKQHRSDGGSGGDLAHSSKRKRASGSGGSSSMGHDGKNAKYGGEKPSGQPGVSKLKSSIRQTQRLLAKPNLAPGTKIEAERRLKTLEQDLEKLQHSKVEKTRAARYHGVKFFERQKLTRRIRRCKRTLDRHTHPSADHDDNDDGDNDDGDGASMDAGEVEEKLRVYRELLHYVLQYPADLRYVALFPEGAAEAVLPNQREKDRTRQRAYAHLQAVRTALAQGTLSTAPEEELEHHDRPKPKLAPSSTVPPAKKHAHRTKPSATRSEQNLPHGIEEDDFFARDSSDE